MALKSTAKKKFSGWIILSKFALIPHQKLTKCFKRSFMGLTTMIADDREPPLVVNICRIIIEPGI